MIGGRGEVARKGLHVGLSLVAAGLVWWLPHPLGATMLAAATAIALSVELARRTSGTFATRFLRWLAPLLRDDEKAGLTGATTLSVGYTVAAAMLPGRAAVGGILFAGVADALAALVGRRWGRHRYPGGKSLEGSLAFLAASFLLALALPGIGPQTAAIVAVALTMVEAITVPVDDNLYLPLVGAMVIRAVAGSAGVGIFS
jgi:dolichol kinase